MEPGALANESQSPQQATQRPEAHLNWVGLLASHAWASMPWASSSCPDLLLEATSSHSTVGELYRVSEYQIIYTDIHRDTWSNGKRLTLQMQLV